MQICSAAVHSMGVLVHSEASVPAMLMLVLKDMHSNTVFLRQLVFPHPVAVHGSVMLCSTASELFASSMSSAYC